MSTIRNATHEQIEIALQETNKTFEDNIIFKRFDSTGKNYSVTLTVKDSKKKGSRLGFPEYDWQTRKVIKPGKHMRSACWHAHGLFYDNLFKINDKIVIVSNGEKITATNNGNWNDRNIGSQMFPLYFSEACECNQNGIAEVI
jgi:hypothetical protein